MQERVTQFLAAPVNFTSVAVFLKEVLHSGTCNVSKIEETGSHLNVADR